MQTRGMNFPSCVVLRQLWDCGPLVRLMCRKMFWEKNWA